MKSAWRFIMAVCLCIFLLCEQTVYAGETEPDVKEELMEELPLQDLETYLKKLFPREKRSIKELFMDLISGEMAFSVEAIMETVKDQFWFEIGQSKASMVQILILAIFAALFHNFSGVFPNSQVAEFGRYAMHFILIAICFNTFHLLVQTVSTGVENLVQFIEVLGPVYFVALTIAIGNVTSAAFYQVILFLISLVETFVLTILIPLVQIYLVMQLVNGFSAEDYLSKFAEFLETVINWSLKSLLAGVFGLNLIQRILNPAIDTLQRSVLLKGGETIPVLGNLIGSAGEVVLGTAVLMKNGIGLVGAVFLLAIGLAPTIKMGIVALIYRLTAALIQPIADKKFTECVSGMANGVGMLLKIEIATCLLFLITIAVAATTSK